MIMEKDDNYQTTGALVPGRAHVQQGPLQLSALLISEPLVTTTLTSQTTHLKVAETNGLWKHWLLPSLGLISLAVLTMQLCASQAQPGLLRPYERSPSAEQRSSST